MNQYILIAFGAVNPSKRYIICWIKKFRYHCSLLSYMYVHCTSLNQINTRKLIKIFSEFFSLLCFINKRTNPMLGFKSFHADLSNDCRDIKYNNGLKRTNHRTNSKSIILQQLCKIDGGVESLEFCIF